MRPPLWFLGLLYLTLSFTCGMYVQDYKDSRTVYRSCMYIARTAKDLQPECVVYWSSIKDSASLYKEDSQ